jgi:2-keto-4-pentenoate hydratase/2-oxohepta-3-ene-1,7-dioic acid hydratase in catechol pathway
VNEGNALDYVAGYMSSNDLSCRIWQRDPKYAGNVPQWCFSKGFDSFAPVGPMIVSAQKLGAGANLSLKTIVNGETRQDSDTSDLLFGVKKIVSFLSQGTTIEKGTLIMTGTPSGVALGMKEPKYLQDGDVVEVAIQGLGSVTNTLKFL